MLLSFVFRVISAIVAFLYPGYASYKTLSQRPASEVELERWLMYWSVLGCLVAVEYIAEWIISWIPFYYLIKTIFLLYLALPQTNGASFLYKTQVEPFFSSHEHEIDSALVQLKAYVYNYLQQLLRSLWGHVATTMGQAPPGQQPNALDEGGLTGDAAINAGAPPSLGDPVSGPAQLVQTFWRSYGPGLLASGAAMFQQAQTAAAASAAQQQYTPPGPSRANSAHSIQERRRQLESELASLSSDPNVQPYDVGSPSSSPVLVPAANNPSRVSSSSSLRDRSGSGNGRSTFEEVEVPSDMEGDGPGPHGPERPGQARRTSWFGWGGANASGRGNYERVKTD